ncbi:MAG: DUF5615 family PIN-like protein [Phycisphaerae bacterium]
MKLLFDQNLSHRLVGKLQRIYPESAHARRIGMASATDEEVWQYARSHGYLIVTKDADLHERSLLFGHPPKIIWVRRGNARRKSSNSSCNPEASQSRSLHKTNPFRS